MVPPPFPKLTVADIRSPVVKVHHHSQAAVFQQVPRPVIAGINGQLLAELEKGLADSSIWQCAIRVRLKPAAQLSSGLLSGE